MFSWFFLWNGNCFLCSLSLFSTCSPLAVGDSSLLNFQINHLQLSPRFFTNFRLRTNHTQTPIEADKRNKSQQLTISCLIFQSESFFNLRPIKFDYASSALERRHTQRVAASCKAELWLPLPQSLSCLIISIAAALYNLLLLCFYVFSLMFVNQPLSRNLKRAQSWLWGLMRFSSTVWSTSRDCNASVSQGCGTDLLRGNSWDIFDWFRLSLKLAGRTGPGQANRTLPPRSDSFAHFCS